MITIEVLNAQDSRRQWLMGNAVGCTLDIGAGTGWMLRHKRDVIFFDRVHPLKQPEAEDEGERDEINKRIIFYHQGDACELPYPDGSFDTVLLGDILEHLEFPVKATCEAFRVAKFQVLITVPDENNWSAWSLPTWLGFGNPGHKRVYTEGSIRAELGEAAEIFRMKGGGTSFFCARLVKDASEVG